jgi:hypothetical protein
LNEIREPYLSGVEGQRAQAENRPVDQGTIDGRDLWSHNLGSWAIDILALVAVAVLSIAGLFGALVMRMRLSPQGRGPAA